MAQNNIQSQIDLLQQTQIQSLSPQQVLTARLTELSIEALRQRVDNECMENPWLEKKEETGNGPDDYENTASSEEEEGEVVYGERPYESTEDDNASVYGAKDDTPRHHLYAQNRAQTPENIEYGDTQSFFDKLESQIYEYDLTSDQREKLKYLIGSLGDDGLLHKPLYQIADEVEIYQGLQTTEEEMQQLLKVLWQFDPLGVGARSVQECLLIQIRHDKGNPLQPLMERVIRDYYDDFIHKRWDFIEQRLHLSHIEMEDLIANLLKLNPRPGTSLGESVSQGSRQITPDFFAKTELDGSVTMTLNEDGVPELKISEDALDTLKSLDTKDMAKLSQAAQENLRFTRSYVDRGQMFINAMGQRKQNMMSTMLAIIKLQKAYFRTGDDTSLRPMKLEDISEITGLDISTVSRVCNSKYVQTSYGIVPLRWFFSKATKQGDEEVSIRMIRAALQEIVENEDKNFPLSDDKLTELLREQGFNVARRTVSKYREQMGIPVARMRK